MIDFVNAKKNYVIILAILFVVVSLSGTTYSLFLKSDVTNEFNYSTGILDLEFVEDEQITIENAFPMIDSKGLEEKTYNLTIKNTGTLPYLFDLKMLSATDENVIDTKYIKVKVNEYDPHTLYLTNNVIASNLILYPEEEMKFKINVWLDINTPNNELGKTFAAKITASGEAIYKTLDTSGANHPDLKENMIPVYYNENSKVWEIADGSNTIETYNWYNYDNQKWANAVIIKNTDKQIYDITRKNNLKIDKIANDNGNAVIEDTPLNLSLSNYNYNAISNILRVKFTNIDTDKTYIITNGNLNYYYDHEKQKFIFEIGKTQVSSSKYEITKNSWHIIGYTYNQNRVNFYIDGVKISTANITGNIGSNSNFKVGTDSKFEKTSSITVGDIYFYNDILTDSEISKNYKTNVDIIYDNLISGYNDFTPKTLKEYYTSKGFGESINQEDIQYQFVWIPRFKYKLWNVTGENDIDSYNAYQKGIDIIFEKGTTSSGLIHCQDNICYSDPLLITKVTKNDNGKYYTHPSFKYLDKEITGMWVSKYELSTTSSQCNKDNKTGCLTTNLTPESKQDNIPWTNNYLSNYYQLIKKINEDYHMIKNTEWGAITYLTHSKYGICQNNTCQNIKPNNTFISGQDSKDSTTNNIYGIFDTAGNNLEFVSGNYANEKGEISIENTHFSSVPVNNYDYELYYENTFILGDATKELSLKEGIWYNSNNIFIDNTNNWFIRGGVANQENSTIFSYSATTDNENNYITTRIVTK